MERHVTCSIREVEPMACWPSCSELAKRFGEAKHLNRTEIEALKRKSDPRNFRTRGTGSKDFAMFISVEGVTAAACRQDKFVSASASAVAPVVHAAPTRTMSTAGVSHSNINKACVDVAGVRDFAAPCYASSAAPKSKLPQNSAITVGPFSRDGSVEGASASKWKWTPDKEITSMQARFPSPCKRMTQCDFNKACKSVEAASWLSMSTHGAPTSPMALSHRAPAPHALSPRTICNTSTISRDLSPRCCLIGNISSVRMQFKSNFPSRLLSSGSFDATNVSDLQSMPPKRCTAPTCAAPVGPAVLVHEPPATGVAYSNAVLVSEKPIIIKDPPTHSHLNSTKFNNDASQCCSNDPFELPQNQNVIAVMSEPSAGHDISAHSCPNSDKADISFSKSPATFPILVNNYSGPEPEVNMTTPRCTRPQTLCWSSPCSSGGTSTSSLSSKTCDSQITLHPMDVNQHNGDLDHHATEKQSASKPVRLLCTNICRAASYGASNTTRQVADDQVSFGAVRRTTSPGECLAARRHRRKSTSSPSLPSSSLRGSLEAFGSPDRRNASPATAKVRGAPSRSPPGSPRSASPTGTNVRKRSPLERTSQQARKLVHVFLKPLDDSETLHTEVERLLFETLPPENVEVLKITPLHNARSRQLFLNLLHEEGGNVSLVRLAWHLAGNAVAADAIQAEGIRCDTRHCTCGRYGRGGYVATSAAKANAYADSECDSGNRHLFLVLVLPEEEVARGKRGTRPLSTAVDYPGHPTEYCFVDDARLHCVCRVDYLWLPTGRREKVTTSGGHVRAWRTRSHVPGGAQTLAGMPHSRGSF